MNFNQVAKDLLLECLDKVSTSNNLLLLDRNISSRIEFLISILDLKRAGKFERLVWLDEFDKYGDELTQFSALIVLLEESNQSLELIQKLSFHSRVNVVVNVLSKPFAISANNKVGGLLKFEDISRSRKSFLLKPGLRLSRWNASPLFIDGVISSQMKYGGLEAYLQLPIQLVSQVAESFRFILENSKDTWGKHLKLRNIYGQGDNSSLFIKIIREQTIPAFISHLGEIQSQYYTEIVSGNSDLVVLERNIDVAALVLTQLSYHGLVDSAFGIDMNKIKSSDESIPFDDELCRQLKDLNFASVGPKLNKIAREIQSAQQMDADANLEEIRKLVLNLGDLQTRQELVRRHTFISESILNFVKNGQIEDIYVSDENEKLLHFENDIMETDYKEHIETLKQFLAANFKGRIIFATLVLISTVNNGISSSDLEWIMKECFENYGLQFNLTLNKCIEIKLIRISQQSDLLSTIRGSGDVESDLNEKLGIASFFNTYKATYTLIDKFWNLHPTSEEAYVKTAIGADLHDEYSEPSFTLPANTVPLTYRLVEALYFRDFLKYKPVNNVSRRPNWDKLGIQQMFRGEVVDLNIEGADKRESEYLIIVLLGGITRSEMSCFNYLQERFDKAGQNKKIILLSSGILNNASLYDSIYT